MRLKVPPGKYVIAVSGGVDSISMLNLLAQQPNLELIVAHFNHGIRPDSDKDEQLVKQIAKKYKLVVEIGRGNLGHDASEEQARTARYKFLEQLKQKHQAKSIITAHHQDDLIETALLNIMRGTRRKGLTAIADNKSITRPLLDIPKSEIITYAKKNNLTWREDSSNIDKRYLRNRIRSQIMPKLSATKRKKILSLIQKTKTLNSELDIILAQLDEQVVKGNLIDRHAFIMLPTNLANELLAYWLRARGFGQFDTKTLHRLNLALRTAKAGTKHPVQANMVLMIGKQSAQFKP